MPKSLGLFLVKNPILSSLTQTKLSKESPWSLHQNLTPFEGKKKSGPHTWAFVEATPDAYVGKMTPVICLSSKIRSVRCLDTHTDSNMSLNIRIRVDLAVRVDVSAPPPIMTWRRSKAIPYSKELLYRVVQPHKIQVK